MESQRLPGVKRMIHPQAAGKTQRQPIKNWNLQNGLLFGDGNCLDPAPAGMCFGVTLCMLNSWWHQKLSSNFLQNRQGI